jgi:hypothetical protein
MHLIVSVKNMTTGITASNTRSPKNGHRLAPARTFIVDGIKTPQLLPLKPAGKRLVCWVVERAMFFDVG